MKIKLEKMQNFVYTQAPFYALLNTRVGAALRTEIEVTGLSCVAGAGYVAALAGDCLTVR